MDRGKNFAKRTLAKPIRGRLLRILERGFDWIVFTVITVIILLSLIFF